MSAARKVSLSERIDVLALRVLTLESVVGLDKIEDALLSRIEAARQAEVPPPKAPRRRKGGAL